jgi:tRNA pseudouridine13 synthase
MKGEEAVLSGLAKGLSMKDSVRRIPHKLKLLFVHAYQSKLFNIAAGKRMTLGNEPIEGDLVLVDDDGVVGSSIAPPSGAARSNASSSVDGVSIDGCDYDYDDEEEDGEARETNQTKFEQKTNKRRGQKGKNVHIVTAAEAANKTFSIDQVVLPLPGHDVKYPTYSAAATAVAVTMKNEGGAVGFFDALLAADGLTQAHLKRNDE